jgi:hypothetical protein
MHFPNHAEVSSELYSKIFANEEIIPKLINDDLIFHKMKANDVESFIKNEYCIDLTLAGIAAFNSNSCLFGGPVSQSYKIKAKTINQRLKKMMILLTK